MFVMCKIVLSLYQSYYPAASRLYQSNAVVLSFSAELNHIERVKGIRIYTMEYTNKCSYDLKLLEAFLVYTYKHTQT